MWWRRRWTLPYQTLRPSRLGCLNRSMQTQPVLSHLAASNVIGVVRSRVEESGEGATVAVVDAHGELAAFLRTDGCRLPSIQIAINKADAAAREQIDSAELGQRSHSEGWPMTNFGDHRYPSWGGGVPIRVGDRIVGAVGVSGLAEDRDIELARLGAAAATS